MKQKGFTLIEMLIVIAVIGVLAVAVLSAINPVEQMRKARDTRRRSNAAELLNALERYFATNEAYPTDYLTESADANDCAGVITAAAGSQITSAGVATLVSTNEIKSEFSNRLGSTGNELYGGIDLTGGTDLATVCFEIESQSNLQNYIGATNCCDSLGAACAATGTAPFYVCLPE